MRVLRHLGIFSLWLALIAPLSAQFGILGRSIPSGSGVAPCDLVTGCVAAYSAQRKLFATYNGPLFQLSRTGGGGGTQDIGTTANGKVDLNAIITFCGTISGNGLSTTTTNTCKVTKVYNQTSQGSANDLIALTNVGGGMACFPPPTGTNTCPAYPILFTVNNAGLPVFANQTDNTAGAFLGAQTPSGFTSGDQPISIYVVGNDTIWNPEDTPFGYSLVFGVEQVMDSVYDLPGSGITLDLRSNPRDYPTCTNGCSDFLNFSVDLQGDLIEIPYALADRDQTEYALTNNIKSYTAIGDYVGAVSYNNTTHMMTLDFQNGLHTYQPTYTHGLDLGKDLTPGQPYKNIIQLREGFTGDGTGSLMGSWYEGLIYTSTLSLDQLHQLEGNGQAYYHINSTAPTCSNGGVDLLGGASVVSGLNHNTLGGAWGLRQLDPARPGVMAVISRVSDSHLMVLATTPGNCTPNYSALNTFCNSTTCHVWDLPNQVLPGTGFMNSNGGTATCEPNCWQQMNHDQTRFTSQQSGTTGLIYTPNNLNTTFPTMDFGTGLSLTTAFTNNQNNAYNSNGTQNAITRPWSMLGAVLRTSTANGIVLKDGAGTNLLGGGSGANQLLVQSSSGTFTATSADGTWHAIAGMVPTNTSLRACVNGSCTTSGAVTTADTATNTWVIGSNFSVSLTEFYLINSTDAGATAAGNLSTVERSIYAF